MTHPLSKAVNMLRCCCSQHVKIYHIRILLLTCLLISYGWNSVRAAEPASNPLLPPTASIDTHKIDAYILAEMKSARIPGAALGIVHGDQIIYTQGYGVADPSGRPVTPQTPFLIGSVSKSITAAAIMQLVEAGQLELDAPVQRYLPWFQPENSQAGSQITVRHLLNHTSGFSTNDGEINFIGTSSGSIQDLARSVGNLRPAGPAGIQHRYSNVNYVLLGAVIEAASGQSYGDYIQQRVFQPLQTHNSYTSLEGAVHAGLAAGYQSFFGLPVARKTSYRADNLPAGYLAASVDDMAHYLSALMNGGSYQGTQILSPASLEALFGSSTAVTSYTRYALGWYTNPEATVVWHNGATTCFRANVKILREDGWGVVMLYNMSDDAMLALFGKGYPILDGVISLLYGEPPFSSGQVTIGNLPFILDVVAAVILLLVGGAAFRLHRFTTNKESPKRHMIANVITALIFFLLPVYILYSVSERVSWPVLLASIPDYGGLVLLISAALLAIGSVRIVLALRWR